MKTFMVKYTFDRGLTVHSVLVCADDKTDAYLQVYLDLPLNVEVSITDLFEIK